MKYHSFFILTFILVFASCKKNNQQEISPKRDTITEAVFASGILDARDRYNLTAQAEGYLSDLLVEEGDSVQLGELIATISNTQNEANYEASRAQLAIAEYNLSANAPALKEARINLESAIAKRDQDKKLLDRYSILHSQGSISDLELENTQLAYTSSKAAVIAIEEKIRNIEQQAKQAEINQRAQKEISASNSGFNRLTALSSGTILKRYKQKGDYVRKGDVIVSIANNQTILARLNVDENSIGKIKSGMPVLIQLNPLRNEVFNGTLQTIYPLFDDASQSFICEVVFTQPLPFQLIGTQLEANIIVGKKENALLIPRTYLNYSNQVIVKGEDDMRTVTVGIVSTEWVEVLDGINEQDVLLPLRK